MCICSYPKQFAKYHFYIPQVTFAWLHEQELGWKTFVASYALLWVPHIYVCNCIDYCCDRYVIGGRWSCDRLCLKMEEYVARALQNVLFVCFLVYNLHWSKNSLAKFPRLNLNSYFLWKDSMFFTFSYDTRCPSFIHPHLDRGYNKKRINYTN